MAHNDDFEAQAPLVQELETAGQRSGWGAAAKLGVGISALALGLAALLAFRSVAPDPLRFREVRGVTNLDGALDSGALALLGTAESDAELLKDVIDDMPVYTDQIGLGKNQDAPEPKTWTIDYKPEFHDWTYDQRKEEADRVFGDKVVFVAEAMPLFMVSCSLSELRQMLQGNHDHFAFVEQDVKDKAIPLLPPNSRRLSEQSNPPSWGLNRVDQRELPMDREYESGSSYADGQGAHVYVFDTGVRTSHTDFQGRAIPTLEVIGRYKTECNGDRNCARDRDGHGTHCAGTVAGFKYGVAKKATIHAVKIMGDNGQGSMSWFERGIDWVISHGPKPAVITASLGGKGRHRSTVVSIDFAVDKGVVVVVASGNENDDACKYTPAHVPSAITVGSTKADDARSDFSNYGTCVDIFAPGSAIVSAGVRSDTNVNTLSGTSMACPHVAGAAALVLGRNPTMSAPDVSKRLVQHATDGTMHDIGLGSPDLLLYVGGAADETTQAPVAPPGGANPQCSTMGWTVQSGDCKIDSECCLISPGFDSGSYPSNSACNIQVGSNPGFISTQHFMTEANFDFLHIGATDGSVVSFHGESDPTNVIPSRGIAWESDGSVEEAGFKVCLEHVGMCPENGWLLQPGCVTHWRYSGKDYDGCALEGHTGGWCIKKHAEHGYFYWTDCIKCRG